MCAMWTNEKHSHGCDATRKCQTKAVLQHKWSNVSMESDSWEEASARKCKKQTWRWREPSVWDKTCLITMTGHREAHSDGWGGKKLRGSSSPLRGADCNCLHVNHFHIKRHHLSLDLQALAGWLWLTPPPPPRYWCLHLCGGKTV